MKKITFTFLIFSLMTTASLAQITAEFSYDDTICGNEITVTDVSTGENVISRAWYQDDILLTGDGPEEYTFSIGTINIADTVTVSLVVEGSTSSDSVAHQVIRYEIPSADFTIIPPRCFGEPASIEANEDYHPVYEWELHGGIVDSIWPPISDTTGNYRILAHWEDGDTVHNIGMQVQNRFGCRSEINDTVIHEPAIPGYELEITPDSCLLGTGSVVFRPDNSMTGFRWIDTAGLDIDDPTDTVQMNIQGGIYRVSQIYPTLNQDYVTFYHELFGDEICRDTFEITVGNQGFIDAGFSVSTSVVYMADPVVYFSYNGDVNDSVFWYFGDGSTSDELNTSHIYQEAGVYTVTLYAYNSNDCGDMLTKTIEVLPGSSINTNQIEDIVIYPNPTGGRITVKSEQEKIQKIEIFDVTGKKMDEMVLDNNRHTFNVTMKQQSGIYLIKLTTESGTYFRKVVVR
ncbi:MAG: T9SS type A sorting domain-containing protein [Bacteroidales bacterium]